MFKNVGADRITVAEALAHPWLARPLVPSSGAMSDADGEGGSGPVPSEGMSEAERAALVADMERRRVEVDRIKREEKEQAVRAKEEARRFVQAGVQGQDTLALCLCVYGQTRALPRARCFFPRPCSFQWSAGVGGGGV
jgi:hypothetical protein